MYICKQMFSFDTFSSGFGLTLNECFVLSSVGMNVAVSIPI